MSKLTRLQVDAALGRAAAGESVRAIAREFHVCESSLRWRFRKEGVHPKQIYQAAAKLAAAECAFELLMARERRSFERMAPRVQRMMRCEFRKLGWDVLPWELG